MYHLQLSLCVYLIANFVPSGLGLKSSNSTRNGKINFCNPTKLSVITVPAFFMKTNGSQEFRVTSKDVKCASTSIIYKTSSVHDDEANFQLDSSGYITYLEEYLLHDEYCISRFETDTIEIKHCKIECGVTHTCIKKCCPPHEVIDFSKGMVEAFCKFSEHEWRPVFYDEHKGCGTRSESDTPYHLLRVTVQDVYSEFQPYKDIKLKLNETSSVVSGLRFRVMKNGDLKVHTHPDGTWATFNNDEFCVDGMMGYVGGETYSGSLAEQTHLDLGPPIFDDEYIDDEVYNVTGNISDVLPPIEISNTKAYTYITLYFIALPFLLACIIIYLLIWEKHNIHGWVQFAFVFTMFLMYIFLANAHWLSVLGTHDLEGHPLCKTVGILAHFFYLSTMCVVEYIMCWITVINVDLWLTFRNIKPRQGISQNVTRFVLYAIFGYGVPLLIVAFGVALDSIYYPTFGDGSECESPVTMPLYGIKNCYLQDKANWEYLYIPMSILLTSNVLTFSSTVFTLYMYKKQTRSAVSGQGSSHQKESLFLFVKLFVVTGVSWIFEILSATSEPSWFWVIFDSYNLLQAILIFIIFALKRENFAFLFHKYPGARFLFVPIMRTRCCFSQTFDPERTEMTAMGLDRTSRIHFRKGSNASSRSSKSIRKDSLS